MAGRQMEDCSVCKQSRTSRSWSPAQWTSFSACIMVDGWWRNCCKDCSTVPGWYHNDAGPKCQSVAAVEDSITSHVYSLSLSSRPSPMKVEPPPSLEPRLQPSWGRPPIPCTNAGVQHTPWSPPVMESEPPPPMKPWQQPSWGPPPISCSKAEMQQHALGPPPMEGEPPPPMEPWPQPSWGPPPMDGGPPPPMEPRRQPSWGPPPMEAEPNLCRGLRQRSWCGSEGASMSASCAT